MEKNSKIVAEISPGELLDKISILEIKIAKIKNKDKQVENIEDKLRILEKNKDYGKAFIDLARSVYINNDERAAIKLKINTILKSNIKEIKEYVTY